MTEERERSYMGLALKIQLMHNQNYNINRIKTTGESLDFNKRFVSAKGG